MCNTVKQQQKKSTKQLRCLCTEIHRCVIEAKKNNNTVCHLTRTIKPKTKTELLYTTLANLIRIYTTPLYLIYEK